MNSKFFRAGIAIACFVFVFGFGMSSVAVAHPLGNDSITHFNILFIRPDRLELDYLLDIAETPSLFLEKNEMDADRDGQITQEELERWVARKAHELPEFIDVRLDQHPLRLSVVPAPRTTASGTANGLPNSSASSSAETSNPNITILPMPSPIGSTYRLVIRYQVNWPEPLAPGEHMLVFEDKTWPEHPGLKRILLDPNLECHDNDTRLAASPNAGSSLSNAPLSTPPPFCRILEPHPPFLSAENNLFRYEQYDPAKLPDIRQATIRFVMSPPVAVSPSIAVSPSASGSPLIAGSSSTSPDTPPTAVGSADTYRSTFLDPVNNPLQTNANQRQAQKMMALLQQRWNFWIFLVVTAVAFGYGAAHALMPGHAKTMVAAYLISQHAHHWHSVLLAIIVTATHTALVIIVGIILAIFQHTSPQVAPMLQLWLGLIAGGMVLSMGVVLARRSISGRLGHHHGHGHGHHHRDHHRHDHVLVDHHHHEHSHALVGSHPRDHHHDHDIHHHAHDAYASHHEHPHEHYAHHHDHHHGNHHNHARTQPESLTLRSLVMLGVTGGMVPCPATVFIMSLGIGANVIVEALYAVVVFSLGLALTLMLIGSLALSSRRFAVKLLADSKEESALSSIGQRWLLRIIPTLSGIVVAGLGSAIVIHYACRLYGMKLPPFAWLG